MVTAIYDGNYQLHRCMRAGDLAGLRNRHGKPTGGLMGFLKSMQKTLTQLNAQRAVVVFDGGISTRRRSLYPQYKGAKYREPDSEFFEPMDEERAQYAKDFSKQGQYLRHALGLLGVRCVKLLGWEADDICFRIAEHYNKQPGSVVLVSDDKDYLQAVHTWRSREPDSEEQYGSISVCRPIADELVTYANFRHLVGHEIGHHLLWRAIEGDGSDKIRGIHGVGKGTLKKIFAEYDGNTRYPYEDFVLWCMEHRTKTVRKIADNFDVLHRNYELMALEQEPYPVEVSDKVKSVLEAPVETDIAAIKYFLTEMDLFSITKYLHKWIVPFQRLR